jgi:transposase
MDIHQNARTTPHSRAGLVRRVNGGELAKTVAAGVGVSDKTVRKWAGRFSREGAAGLADRSSRPHRLRRRRRQHWSSRRSRCATSAS